MDDDNGLDNQIELVDSLIKQNKRQDRHERQMATLDDVELEMREAIKAKRKRVDALQEQLELYMTRLGNLRSDLELARIKRRPFSWWVLVLANMFLMFHSYAHGNVPFVCFNGYAFLLNWRLLYVRHSHMANVVSIVVVVLSLWLV